MVSARCHLRTGRGDLFAGWPVSSGMRKLGILFVGVLFLGVVGCAKTAPLPQAPQNGTAAKATVNGSGIATDGPGELAVGKEPADREASAKARNSTWIGAAPEGDLLS